MTISVIGKSDKTYFAKYFQYVSCVTHLGFLFVADVQGTYQRYC